MKKRKDVQDVQFQLIVELLERIADPFKKPNEKSKLMSTFIKRYSSGIDLYPLIRLLCPELDRDRNSFGLKEIYLAKLFATALGLPKTEREKLLQYKDPFVCAGLKAKSGEFSSVVYAVLEKRVVTPSKDITIKDLNDSLTEIHNTPMQNKHNPFIQLVKKTSALELKWVTRIILKDLKIGLGYQRILKMINPNALDLYNRTGDLEEVLTMISNIDETFGCENAAKETLNPLEQNSHHEIFSRRIKPMLAERLNIESLPNLFEDAKEYYVERKFDGERILAHVNTQENEVKFFTRRGTEYSSMLASGLTQEVLTAVRGQRIVLDGELLSWDDTQNDFVPFGHNRTVALGAVENTNLIYMVFDILFYENSNGQIISLLGYPLSERRDFLHRIVKSTENKVHVIEHTNASTEEDIHVQFKKAENQKQEGIIVKCTKSLYLPNARKRGGWFKIKPAFGTLSDSLDLIVIGAYLSEGSKRRFQGSLDLVDHVSSFLLGVLDEADNRRVISFCKVGTGYSIVELQEIRNYLRPAAVKYVGPESAPWLGNFAFASKEKPDLSFPPEKSFVMEVKGGEAVPSVNFEMGYTLRFPRAVRSMRKDKQWDQTMKQNELKVQQTDRCLNKN